MTRDLILAHLAELVSADTQNPPRRIRPTDPLFDHLRGVLAGGFDLALTDHGKGRISLLAVRGKPETLFQCHLDTVPAAGDWSVPPLELTVADGRAWGRGVCDVKGAAACLLALAEETEAPLALLLSTDEEGEESCCVEAFTRAGAARAFRQVVVCEPTECRAVTAHRGYLSVRGRFPGVAGHSSEPRALEGSANHRMARWAAAALEHCRAEKAAERTTCFNLGRVEGGVKSNVIADRAEVAWSARLAPGESNDAFLDRISRLAGGEAEWRVSFSGPPLPAAGRDGRSARRFVRRHGLPHGDPVPFWTEASLFSAAGSPALVLGPGCIAQAHTVDEWVTLEQLERAFHLYARIVSADDRTA